MELKEHRIYTIRKGGKTHVVALMKLIKKDTVKCLYIGKDYDVYGWDVGKNYTLQVKGDKIQDNSGVYHSLEVREPTEEEFLKIVL